MKLLLIHPGIAAISTRVLEKEGFIVEKTATLTKGAELTAIYFYDVVIVCVTSPDKELFGFLSSTGNNSHRTGIIVVSDEVDIDLKVRTLLEGADDYIVRPVHLTEIIARIITLIRRCTMDGEKTITRHEVTIEPASREVTCCGRPVTLTRKEYELLFFFLRNPDKILTHEMIAEYLWGDLKSLSADCFDFIYSHVKNIRKKLAKAGSSQLINTVYGVGYVIR